MVYDVGEELVVEPMARVHVRVGMTYQVVQYNPINVALEVEMDCLADEVDEWEEELYRKLEQKLMNRLHDLADRVRSEGLV